ncbi:MAG: metallophosphoesterase [Clostridia bacterium]|nr:metallophosphoesterase [Clostridia bacterium]
MTREVNHITVRSERVKSPLTFAVVADLHDGLFEDILEELAGCDAILIVGDLVDRHARTTPGYENAVRFLEAAPKLAPTFYAIGNHERCHKRREAYYSHVEKSRVTVLDDAFTEFGGIIIGALTSRKEGKARAGFLREMEKRSEFRLLMCHHPEYFPRHIRAYDIDLTLSGHAHGGQVRIGRQGLFSPGQGWLPRLTSGFYFDGRLLVSRGMTNATWAPRINCNCELIILHLEGK